MLAGVSSPACPALLGVFSINRRPRKSEIRWSGIRELYPPNRKKRIRYTYPHHLKHSIISFYPSSGKKKRSRRNEPDRETYVRAARYASQEGKDTPSRGKFHSVLLLQQGKTRTNNQIADSEQEFDMYEPRSWRERTASKKKIPMDEATYIERYLTSWIPHTLTFLSRCVCFFVLQFFPKTHFKTSASPSHPLHTPHACAMPPKRTLAAKAPEKPERASRRGRGAAPECGICLRCMEWMFKGTLKPARGVRRACVPC